MAHVLVTGSSTGLGLAAAHDVAAPGHEVVVHARSAARAAGLPPFAGTVVGDLGELAGVRDVAAQANAIGPFDAVIHNAGVYPQGGREVASDGFPVVLVVNVLAPYLLTMLVRPVHRLVYLSSDMHTSGRPELDDLAWTRRRWNGTQAYCDSKLLVTTLALAVARRWPQVHSHAVDPGWVATRMGGAGAPDDLVAGAHTQAWLAVSDDADARTSGGYWYHRGRTEPARAAIDAGFQDALLAELARLTGVPFDGGPGAPLAP